MNRVERLFAEIESRPVGLAPAVAAFLAIALLRYFLENLLEAAHVLALRSELRQGVTDLAHVIISWAVVLLLIATGVAAASGRDLKRVSRVALAGFPLICLPPLLDLALGTPGKITYQHDFSRLGHALVNVFNPTESIAFVTPGVRIEVGCGMVLAAVYTSLCTTGRWRWLRAGLAAAWIYLTVFLLGFLPAAWQLILDGSEALLIDASTLGVRSIESALLWYLPLFLPLLAFWLAAVNPPAWRALLSSLRPSRLLGYLALTNLGLMATPTAGGLGVQSFNAYDWGEWLLMNLSLVLAFIALTILNDWHDRDIDAISNPQRPLPSGDIAPAEFAALGVICGVAALALAVVIDETTLYVMLPILSLGWLYSAPPFRLRSFLGIAHANLTGIASLAYLYGAATAAGNAISRNIDLHQLVALALMFFFASHFKDIKDADGDRRAGVSTLATRFGPDAAYWIAGTGLLAAMTLLAAWGLLGPLQRSIPAAAIFLAGWLALRNAEHLMWVMVLALLVLMA